MLLGSTPSAYVASYTLLEQDFEIPILDQTGISSKATQGITLLRCGQHCYPLRTRTSLQYKSGRIVFATLGLEGVGETEEVALSDLGKKVHLEFQNLNAKDPLSRTLVEQERMFRYSQIIDVEGYAHARSETVRTVAKVVAKKKELGLKLDVDETSEWFPWETLPPEAVPLHVGQFALGTFTRERGIFTQCLDLQIMPSLEGDVSSNEVEKFLVPDDSPVDTEWKERDEPGQSLHP